MTSQFRKRPSSAKRHIKYECFTQFVSASRLRQVQSLLDDPNGDMAKKSTGIDAILCMSGIDSRYNEGCYELINYLLFGFFDVRKVELEKSGFADEVIDDLMLVIRKTRVDVYCNPINWHYFLPYISHWTNVTFHCLQDQEYDLETDEGAEKSEDFKVQSLISMTTGCKNIGIPFYGLSTGLEERKFDKMLVEKWPLIQAFAGEDFGGGGFFTLKYTVTDVSPSVHKTYSIQDPVTVEMLTTENLPMMERQWRTMCDCVSMEIAKSKGVLTQNRIEEPLRSFFQHGRAGTLRVTMGTYKLPYVLFGKQSSKSNIEAAQTGFSVDPCELKLSPTNTVGHMVCQVMSPRSPLTCTRTYFVSHILSPLLDSVNEPSEDNQNDSPSIDGNAGITDRTQLRFLVTLYQAMVDAVVAAIQLYTQSGSLAQATLKAIEILNEECQEILTSTLASYLADKSKVVFSLESVQKDGSVEVLLEWERVQMVKVATLCLFDVPDAKDSATSPGSLVFSECFIDSAILVTTGIQTSVDTDILYLTSHIPRFSLWSASEDVVEDHSKLKSQLESGFQGKFGKPLMVGDKAEVTTGSELTLPPESVALYLYQNGLAVYSDTYGAFALSSADCSLLHLFDGDSMSTAVLLIVTYDSSSACKLPPHLITSDYMLFFVFQPHSRAHSHLYGQVLTSWKSDSDMPQVTRIEAEDLPDQLTALHQYLQQVRRQDALHNLLMAPPSNSLKDAAHNLPDLPEFVKHLAVSSAVNNNAVNKADLSHLLQREPDFQVTSDKEQVIVTILTGVPGSEKQSLCKSLTLLGTDYIRWVVVRQMEEAVLDVVQVHKMLSSAVTSHLQQDKNKRQTRVLLVAPGFVTTPEVVSTIMRHPDSNVRNMLKIGAVTACIDPLNIFMQNRMVLPMVLNQCAQGWVNNIIFTSQTRAPSALLDQIQSIIRSINSDVALLLAESGEIKRSTDLDRVLSDSAFEQSAMIRARLLLYPNWTSPKVSTLKRPIEMNDVILKFSRPLERTKLIQRIKGLHRSLSKFPFEGNIYHIYGLVCFSDASSTVDLQYTTLSQSLVVHTVGSHSQPVIRGQPQYYMVFTGCMLDEGTLKDWLRACSKQKPDKKKRITLSDLTPEDLSKVHKEHHLESLPSGWFYNGTHFVSMAGDKSDKHPSMKEFVADYLKRTNEEIDRYNAAIDNEKFPDLFT